MKKARKYLKISWGMTLIILLMWLLADIGICKKSRFDWDGDYNIYIDAEDGYSYRVIETYYGLGKTLYYSRRLDKLTDSIEKKIPDDWGETSREITLGGIRPWWLWWTEQLPGFRLGWLLIVFFLIQYVFLIRRKSKKTKSFAYPIQHSVKRRRYSRPAKNIVELPNTRFLVHPVGIYIVTGFILIFAAFFLIMDLYLVFYLNLPYEHEFIGNSKISTTNGIDASFMNFEYILPSIVYFVASVISAFCIIRYIKKVKDFATQTNDMSLN